jgi:hypothetical protein
MQYLMHQLGPATPEIVTISQQDIDNWLVEFDEGVSIDLSWQDAPARILMCCSLGQPEETDRENIYASLLGANFLLTGVASVKLALSQPENDVMLIGEYEPGDASLASLQKNIVEFLQYAGRYSHLVVDPAFFNAEEPFEAKPFHTQASVTQKLNQI